MIALYISLESAIHRLLKLCKSQRSSCPVCAQAICSPERDHRDKSRAGNGRTYVIIASFP